MNISMAFIRLFFFLLSILFIASYVISGTEGTTFSRIVLGVLAGGLIGALLLATDFLFKRFNLRAFNIAALGLLFGYIMGEAIMLILKSALELTPIMATPETFSIVKVIVFLFSAYLGMALTARASEELYFSVPFIKFKPTAQKKKDLLIDSSILLDTRIIDLAASGLLDSHLILPRFTLKELYASSETGDEIAKSKARRCLDVIKKLESNPHLDLRYAETDFPEVKDPTSKLVRLARLLDANIITADINRIQQSSIEGIRVINIHALSNALKPITQTGEYVTIKIQRYGKEPRQGIGYLDDGTMVVVNGGAEYIGESIKAQVLSVKHTSSGRMIFCNAAEESMLSEDADLAQLASMENAHKNYFAL